MKIRLDKALIVRAYCYTFQAERSLHKASVNGWLALLEFYSSARRDAIRRVINQLVDLLATSGLSTYVVHREQVPGAWVGPFRYHFGHWIADWKTSWKFPHDELSLLIHALERFLRTLEKPAAPELTYLIDLRMDLSWARSLIEYRCHRLQVFRDSSRIEHLYQSDWLQPISVEEIVGEAPIGPAARKVAG